MIVAVVQARMGSTRLPGKVLADIAGHPMLWHVLNRTRRARLLDEVVTATSTEASDVPVALFCEQEKNPCFRGSEDDVLDRYYRAAQAYQASVVVRITADCPLIDPAVVDEVIDVYLKGDYDYVTNTAPPSFPDGLDTEVFSFQALERAWHEAMRQSEREHVTPYIRTHPELFRMGNVASEEDLSGMRWTVDKPEDLEFVRAVYEHANGMLFNMEHVIDLLKRHPEFLEINPGIERNEGYQKSLREDRLVSKEWD